MEKSGLGIRSLVFCVRIARFFLGESAIHSFQSLKRKCRSFCLYCTVILLFCFGHIKGKSMVKRTHLKRITLKRSESLFHKE